MDKYFRNIIILITLVLLCGCSSSNTTNGSMTDRAGNIINVPESIETIISMSPAYTQILVELGLEDKIIAIDKFSEEFIPTGKYLPQFDIMSPNTEAIIALNPDIVFATAMSMVEGQNPFKPLMDAGICVAYIPSSESIADIKKDISFIGDITNCSEKATGLINTMDEEISAIKSIGATITDKKNVYFELDCMPQLYSFGKDVFLNEMLDIIGAKNVFSDQDSWIAVSDEAVIKANPDVILTNVSYIENSVELIKNRSGWNVINAVKSDDIYLIDTNSSTMPTHKIITALKQMANAVYPEVFKD